MADSTIGTQINCRQCAAPLPIEQGTQFVTCGFCGATNFVDKARAVFHYSVRSTVREADALSALRR
jgi:LSD1 subclass zinc finger protein